MASWVFWLACQVPATLQRAGSSVWILELSGHSCPFGERCGASFTGHLYCVPFCHIPACSVGESVAVPFFWSGRKWAGFFVEGFVWRFYPGRTFGTITPIRQVKSSWKVSKRRHLGTCPQFSLESAGLRSLIPQGGFKAQSRYSRIERCPTEKDYSFS